MAESQTSSSTLARRGLMFILSSPSGAGKTTISRMLLGADDEINYWRRLYAKDADAIEEAKKEM